MNQMDKRLKLHSELEEILGSKNVYFQPPENVKIKYDAIIYKRSTPSVIHADNKSYLFTQAYEVTTVTLDPDTDLMEKIITHFSTVRPGRHYVSDNLNHDTCTVYY